ncbi:Flavin mononucleotide phosphatase YigB [Betaproteobacteria bacterium MOLA814]|jgi:putative hydrolase of the HAD superfamily|nr:Flavin mononucleotide phosphatase YigB [Betaproteobacteria bacterium MOLA814]|tara:strand:- start:1175 stop:1873 length:699 start_codon:yes stop_codon:yes gene_type:complete
MIKVITFDLDDTLWAIAPVIHKANELMLVWMKRHAPKFAQTYDDQGIAQLRDEVLANRPDMAHDLSQTRIAFVELGLSRCGYHNAQALSLDAFDVYVAARNDVVLFEGTRDQIATLKLSYQIGALTNGNADLTQVGIGHLFDFHFNSAHIGVSKPHPDFFARALAHTGHGADSFIHVGDNPAHDIAGAQAVGMRTIWMNPDNNPWPDGYTRACAEIHHLDQLGPAVAQINGN